MKKKILIFLLAASLIATLVSSCGNHTNNTESTAEVGTIVESELEPENSLTSLGETITLNVVDSKLYITNLATMVTGVNMVANNSEYALPKYGSDRTELNWTYISASKFENKTENGVRTDGLIYTFKEETQNLLLRVYCKVRPELSGAFEMYSEIENFNENEYRITPNNFASVTFDIPDAENTNIVRIAKEGFIAEGMAQNKSSGIMYAGDGVDVLQLSKKNRIITKCTPNSYNNGFNYLAQYIDRENDGIFVAMSWTAGVITSNRQIDDSDNTSVLVEFNIDYEDSTGGGEFSTRIPAHETLLLPSIYIMPYNGSVDDGSNVFKSWFFDCQVVSTLRDDESLPYLTIDGDMGDPAVALNTGIESIKWDYGWWSGYGFTADYALPFEGSWTAMAYGGDSYAKKTADLAAYGQKLNDLGLNFVTYILLHDTLDFEGNPTDVYGEFNSLTHPEWFSNQKHPHCYLADLGNEECVKYLKTTLENFFQKNNVNQWRTDFEPIAVRSNKENRHDAYGTDVIYWCTVGFSEIVEHLYDTVDGFKYESCSSGGGNKDLYLAKLASFFNCDDTANYLSLRTSFYDSSYIIHPAQLQLPCNIDTFNPTKTDYYFPVVEEPEIEEGDEYDFYGSMMDMGFRSTILGSSNWAPWTGEPQIEYYKEYSVIYKEKVRPLVREAELYHILPRPDGTNWDGIMYADPDSENEIKGAVFLFKPSVEVENVYNVLFDGLDEETVYQLTFEDRKAQNCTATGAELMTYGLEVEIKYIGSEIIWITEAE